MHTEGKTYRVWRVHVEKNLHIPATPDTPAPGEDMNDPAYNFGKRSISVPVLAFGYLWWLVGRAASTT
jgi:hypothetical protein